MLSCSMLLWLIHFKLGVSVQGQLRTMENCCAEAGGWAETTYLLYRSS